MWSPVVSQCGLPMWCPRYGIPCGVQVMGIQRFIHFTESTHISFLSFLYKYIYHIVTCICRHNIFILEVYVKNRSPKCLNFQHFE